MLTTHQTEILLQPIDPNRVAHRDGMSHLQVWDVRRWLIRVFGHGGFSLDVLDTTLLYEDTEHTLNSGKPGVSVAYRATVRLTIYTTEGFQTATYTEAAVGDGVMPLFKRADAHDFALKTAVSQATKRCAVNLGDQFGLSLYANTNAAVVKDTLPHKMASGRKRVSEETDEPVVEVEHDPTTEPAPEPEPETEETEETETAETAETEETEEPAELPLTADSLATALIEAARISRKAERTRTVTRLGIEASKHGLQQATTTHGVTIAMLIDRAFAGEVTA